jgi:hypothetical protein
MRQTYAYLTQLIDAAMQPDRAPSMPLLGPLTGLALALVLWSVLGWLFWSFAS